MRLLDLFEGRDAPLYHGTSLNGAVQILKHDAILPRTAGIRLPGYSGEGDGPLGASLTRNLQAAWDFGSVVFQLDQRRLVQRVRLVPYDYWGQSAEVKGGIAARRKGDKAEAEEFAVGGVPNVSRYITQIWVARTRYRVLVDGGVTGGEALLRHPLLKICAVPLGCGIVTRGK
jgi:hypothetical protein